MCVYTNDDLYKKVTDFQAIYRVENIKRSLPTTYLLPSSDGSYITS